MSQINLDCWANSVTTSTVTQVVLLATFRPVERGGGGKVFPGSATFGGPRRRSKILKMVSQMASF